MKPIQNNSSQDNYVPYSLHNIDNYKKNIVNNTNDILNKYSLNYLDRNIKTVSQYENNKNDDNIGKYYEKYKKLLT